MRLRLNSRRRNQAALPVLPRGLLLGAGVALLSLAAGASPEASGSAVSSPSEHEARRVFPLKEEETERKVMCQYLVYSEPRFICGPPPMEDVKKRCDEMASEARGEPAECSCTDDQNYIQDVCD